MVNQNRDSGPPWAELLGRAIDSRLADVRVAIPGFVETYDAATRTATIRLGTKDVVQSTTGGDVEEEIPLLQNVRVLFPSAAGFDIHFPLAAGDGVLCVFCDRSISELRTTGKVSAPGDQTLHGLSSAVAIPGWNIDSEVGSDTDVSLGIPGGLRIHFGGTADVGGGAQFVALANLVLTELNKIKTMFDGWTPVPNDGGAALKTASASLSFTAPASSNLKAD